MTSAQAKEFIAKYPNAKSFVKPSHLEPLSQLLEVHVEAIEVRKDEFHDLQGSFAPKKETLDKFAQAAGVSFNATADTTRKEGDGCYVGTAQAMLMGPDGKMILGAICEYEFDVSVRVEEAKLKGKADWSNKDSRGRPGPRPYTEIELASERVQFLKVGRQRANTGARNRATLAILGMQTGFKGLFAENDGPNATRTFLFSRIIINAKNELVMNRMLDNLGPNVALLAGPQPAARASHTQAPGDNDFRDVTEPPAAGGFADVPFDEAPAAQAEDPRVEELVSQLGEWTIVENKAIANCAKAVLDGGESRPDVLALALSLIKYLATGNARGAKLCADALYMKPLDPVILADLAKKTTPGVAA